MKLLSFLFEITFRPTSLSHTHSFFMATVDRMPLWVMKAIWGLGCNNKIKRECVSPQVSGLTGHPVIIWVGCPSKLIIGMIFFHWWLCVFGGEAVQIDILLFLLRDVNEAWMCSASELWLVSAHVQASLYV